MKKTFFTHQQDPIWAMLCVFSIDLPQNEYQEPSSFVYPRLIYGTNGVVYLLTTDCIAAKVCDHVTIKSANTSDLPAIIEFFWHPGTSFNSST